MRRINQNSRTAKSIKNSLVALVFYFVNLVLQFYLRKIILDYLGSEILGLNTTAVNLIQFLNLAELGIGSAIAFSLYKPLSENNHKKINEIISLQKYMYRNIAFIVIIGAIILMLFFPIIFHKIHLPLWYAYATYIVLLIGSLQSYFWNYRQVILTADQKDYKIQYSFRLAILVKSIAQIIILPIVPNPYIWWLILELVFGVVATFALNITITKTYPYIEKSNLTRKELLLKYPQIAIKIKQLLFHKIGGFVLTQTSPLIIYAYSTLTLVAYYGNYMLIIAGVTSLLSSLFNSMNSGVGNLIASSDKKNVMSVFSEIFSLRFIIVSTSAFLLIKLTPCFITLWIGEKYLLPEVTLYLLVAVFYINTMRLTIDSFLNGYGQYGDIFSPIAEAILNIGMSILLGKIFGLNGIIGGVLISLLIIIFIWKPIYLFSKHLKGYLHRYALEYIIHIIAAVITFFLISPIYKDFISNISYWNLIKYVAVVGLSFFITLSAILYLCNMGIKQVIKRFV